MRSNGTTRRLDGANELTGPPAREVSRSADLHLRVSKGLFLAGAFASFLFSVYLWFLVDREQGLFVGLWVPSILSLGALLFSGKGGAR